jgi:hypothetical protein
VLEVLLWFAATVPQHDADATMVLIAGGTKEQKAAISA